MASYKGTKYEGWVGIQVRVPPALHKELAHRAVDEGTNLIEITHAGLLGYLEGDVKVDTTEINEILGEWVDVSH